MLVVMSQLSSVHVLSSSQEGGQIALSILAASIGMSASTREIPDVSPHETNQNNPKLVAAAFKQKILVFEHIDSIALR
jgi:hypothetical protein